MSARTSAQSQKVAVPAFTPTPSVTLQRKCACGQHTVSGGECAECSTKKLDLQRRAAPSPNRGKGWGEGQSVPPIVHEVLRSPGQPLDRSTRLFMEPRFGHDFSRVRVHTDARAAESARAVNALAYTVGRDVVFLAGQYAPGTAAGGRVLAHELTHVVQQSDKGISGSALELGEVNGSHEREAESVSARWGDTAGDASSILTAQGFKHAPSRTLQRLGPAAAAAAGAAVGVAAGIASFEAALAYARSLSTRYPGWLSALPNCPCTEAAVKAAPGTWESDQNPALEWFHPGAATSYRSKSTFSSVPGTAHGQQCTYDSAGALITEGPGAGTPDVWSPTTNTANHLLYDAATWQLLGWRIYDRYWVPNNGKGCSANRGEHTLLRELSEFLL